MKFPKLKRLAEQTAATFRAEFPDQEPSLSWLAEAASIVRVPDKQRDAYFSEVRAALRKAPSGGLSFTVHSGSGAELLTCTTYLEARRRWGSYLATSPVPSGHAGILVMDGPNQFTLDAEYLDRVVGFGTPSEREPTADEVRSAFFR